MRQIITISAVAAALTALAGAGGWVWQRQASEANRQAGNAVVPKPSETECVALANILGKIDAGRMIATDEETQRFEQRRARCFESDSSVGPARKVSGTGQL